MGDSVLVFFKRKTEWISRDSNMLALIPRHIPLWQTPLPRKAVFLVFGVTACSQYLQACLQQDLALMQCQSWQVAEQLSCGWGNHLDPSGSFTGLYRHYLAPYPPYSWLRGMRFRHNACGLNILGFYIKLSLQEFNSVESCASGNMSF